MAEGNYARNFSATLVYELVYDLLLVSVTDKLWWVFEEIMQISCTKIVDFGTVSYKWCRTD